MVKSGKSNSNFNINCADLNLSRHSELEGVTYVKKNRPPECYPRAAHGLRIFIEVPADVSMDLNIQVIK